VGWPGLPITGFACAGRVRYTDLEVAESTLVLHQAAGAELHVRRGDFTWKFTTVSGCFDFYPAGVYDELNSIGSGARGLAITLPAAFEHLVSQEGNRASLLTPRFQFQDRRLERLVQALLERCAKEQPGPEEVTVSLAAADRLQELLGTARAEDRAPAFSPILRRLVKEHLDRTLHAPVDADAVAALTGLARTQFSLAFRQSFGSSLHQYVVDLRIGRAKQHLLSTEASLTELAYQLGFASHAHFSTVFKNRVGVTPSQFRQDQVKGLSTSAP
jgi:AraC-like DNA-binding protein